MVECRRTWGWLLGLLVGLLGGLVAVPEVAADYLNGIDVSSYQGSVNWTAVKNAGIQGAVCKATEGTYYTDAYLNRNVSGIKANGMVAGCYHYARPSISASSQATYFTNAVRNANGGSYHGLLQLVVDLEQSDGLSSSAVFSWLSTFVSRVQSITGRPCIIYTYYYFWVDNVGNSSNNLNCPLWIATYGPSPLIPNAWSSVGWAFWQYTSTGRVNGVSGNVDRDYFRHGGSYPHIGALQIP